MNTNMKMEKPRAERERELWGIATGPDGNRRIRLMWNAQNGIPEGSYLPGLPLGTEWAIEEILKHEYPNA